MTMPPVDLSSMESYHRSCLEIARAQLAGFVSIEEVAAAEDEINAYPNLSELSTPLGVHILEENITGSAVEYAHKAVLDGRVFWEHTAAGEATRLKMGNKFLINPARDLTLARMATALSEELGQPHSPAEILAETRVDPTDLLPLSLGQRHLLQLTFDLTKLADEAGQDPAAVLGRQKTLLVLSKQTTQAILDKVTRANFFGLSRDNFFFMIQETFHGISIDSGHFAFDPTSPKRLHNHGQLVMQETMDDQIFRLDEFGERVYLKSSQVAEILDGALDKISYNIEDLDYLTRSMSWRSLALALKFGALGAAMVMEIVANNPRKPQKGGLAAFDAVLDRNVMVESFQLRGLPNSEIKFLNKNFNHYPNPAVSFRALRENGLPMPISVKKGRIYFQPVQGDINFLVPTEFVRRQVLKPIHSWKSAATTPEAIRAMGAQDRQSGFQDFAAGFVEF